MDILAILSKCIVLVNLSFSVVSILQLQIHISTRRT
jgi:hypothetical protein